MAILVARNLKAYYSITGGLGERLHVHAVDGVNLVINEREIFGIAGESGCGKSTLIKVLYGLVKPPLTVLEGDVYYNIDDNRVHILSLDERERRGIWWKVISYIPQGSMSVLNPTIRIRDQFLDVMKIHTKSFDKREALEVVEKHVQNLGLPIEVLSSYPHQLSGGMRQRVIIALATILKPRVIFADEPTTALDVIVQRGVLEMLRRLQKELSNTIVIVTHDMGVQAQISHRIAVMYAGKIIEVAPTMEIFKHPVHPYTKYLIASLPKIGDRAKRPSIRGRPPSLVNPPPGCRFAPRCPAKRDLCLEREPGLVEIRPGHFVACHYHEGEEV